MKLIQLTTQTFLDKTASSEPIPGGGSISALCGSVAASLTQMVAGLTIGKKRYVEVESQMQQILRDATKIRERLMSYIDKDSEAYDLVFSALKLPKETDEEKRIRAEKIQKATKDAATIPMEVAELVYDLIPQIEAVVKRGNQNAITDGCVAMMCARTAVLGALLNVRINLSSIKDEDFVRTYTDKASRLEREIREIEADILSYTYGSIQ